MLIRCIILLALFGPLCLFSATDKTEDEAVEIRSADSVTEGKPAADRNDLAKLESEDVQLRAEDVQVESEKSQIESEIDRLKNELVRLEDENKQLQGENSTLRKELLETLDKHSAIANRLKRFELSAAGIVETLSPVYIGEREADLLDALAMTLKSGNELLLKSSVLQDLVLRHLPGMELDDVESTRFRVALEEIQTAQNRFAMLNVPPAEVGGVGQCRILEVNDTLKTVVLSAGYRNGVRIGMMLKAGENGEYSLKVTAVRAFVSAAMVLETDDFRGLAPGMPVRAARSDE